MNYINKLATQNPVYVNQGSITNWECIRDDVHAEDMLRDVFDYARQNNISLNSIEMSFTSGGRVLDNIFVERLWRGFDEHFAITLFPIHNLLNACPM